MQSLKQTQSQTTKLSMQTYLPILQFSSKELEDHLGEIERNNPYLKVRKKRPHNSKEADFSNIIATESLYEHLEAQITPPLFPTPLSQSIALEIIKYINLEGYYEGDNEHIADKLQVDAEDIEKIRLRFSRLTPSGAGACCLKESLKFQVDDLDAPEDIAELCKTIIDDMENSHKYFKHPAYIIAKATISKLNNPPALSFLEEHRSISADIIVTINGDQFTITDNSGLEVEISDAKDTAKKQKNEARKLIELIKLRESTLLNLTHEIVKKQLDFFKGGSLKPLGMQEIADIVNMNQSTISRAVRGKYLECARGVFELRHFFVTEISQDISSAKIKEFIKTLIDEEGDSPLSDDDLVFVVNKELKTTISRRTISKYRLALNIPNKKERARQKLT